MFTRTERRVRRNSLVPGLKEPRNQRKHGSDFIAFSAQDLIPIYGSTHAMYENIDEYNDGRKSFNQAAYDSIVIGVFTAATFAASVVHMPSLGSVRLARTMVATTPTITAASLLAIGVHATTKPSADVEHGPHGTQRVTPRLGWKLF